MPNLRTSHPDRPCPWNGRARRLRAKLARWQADRRPRPASTELVVAGQPWLSVEAYVSVIDGAAVIEIDTYALDPERRCRVHVNDGPAYDAVPDIGDHDIEHLTGLHEQEHLALLRAAEAKRTEYPDVPRWPYVEGDPDDLGRDRPLVTLDQIVRWGGTVLTEDELDRLVTAIPKSSIPDVIAEIVTAITTTGQQSTPHRPETVDHDNPA